MMKGAKSPFKSLVESALTNKPLLQLKTNKQNSLIDFLSTLPENLSKAATLENIRHGFVANGFVDRSSFQVPDVDAILATLGHDMQQEEYRLIVDSFPQLY